MGALYSIRFLFVVRSCPGKAAASSPWVAGKTRERIVNLIPKGAVNDQTRMVLVQFFWGDHPHQCLRERHRQR